MTRIQEAIKEFIFLGFPKSYLDQNNSYDSYRHNKSQAFEGRSSDIALSLLGSSDIATVARYPGIN